MRLFAIFMSFMLIAQCIANNDYSIYYQKTNDTRCLRLSNGCRHQSIRHTSESYIENTFVCTRLDSSFRLSPTEMSLFSNKCHFKVVNFYFRLERPQIIDWKFDLINLFSLVLDKIGQTRDLLIIFKDVKGFDINSFSFQSIPIPINLEFFDPEFQFYSNKSQVDSSSYCQESSRQKTRSIFQSPSWGGAISFYRPRFSKSPICPHFLSGSMFKCLQFNTMIDTYYKQNVLKFANNSKNISTNFVQLDLYDLFNVHIDATILNPFVFNNVRRIWLDGYIRSIHPDAFRAFTRIEKISFNALFFRQLAHTDMSWMHGLNTNINVDLENLKADNLVNESIFRKSVYIRISLLTTLENNQGYKDLRHSRMFPNEDFCLYKNFPFRNLVMLVKKKFDRETMQLSCTYLWLVRFPWMFAKYLSKEEISHMPNYLNLSSEIQNCTFKRR